MCQGSTYLSYVQVLVYYKIEIHWPQPDISAKFVGLLVKDGEENRDHGDLANSSHTSLKTSLPYRSEVKVTKYIL